MAPQKAASNTSSSQFSQRHSEVNQFIASNYSLRYVQDSIYMVLIYLRFNNPSIYFYKYQFFCTPSIWVFYIIQSKIMKTNFLRCTTNRSCTNSNKQIGKIRAGFPSIAVKSSRRGQYINMASDGKAKKTNFCIQEIKLENNKWLVFNEQTERETAQMFWGYSNLRKMPHNAINNQKKVGVSSTKENTRFITDFQEKKTVPVKPETCLIKKQQRYLKLRASRKVTLADKQENTIRQSVSPSTNNFKNHSKSNKSARSMRSASSNHSVNYSKKHQKDPIRSNVSIIQEKTQEMLKTTEEFKEQKTKEKILAQEYLENKRIFIATIYDPIQLLNPNLLKNNLCTDFYEDFPEWKNTIIEIPVKNQYNEQEAPNSLSPQIQACIESTISKSVQQNLSRSQTAQQAPHIIQAPTLINQQFPQPIPQKNEQIQQITEVKEVKPSNQYLITTSTQPPQKTQCSHTQLQLTPQIQLQKIPQTFHQTRQQSKSVFDQLEQLSKFKDIRLIYIDSNQQTALIPTKFTNQYLVPIPSTSVLHNQFKNDEILYFINHLIFTFPHLIKNAFLSPARKGFSCLLFVNGERKIITVDGLFPFDANYYPLYGYFDQFIWFSVLTKCIAKMYGSYSTINNLTFRNIYQMLSGQVIINYDVKLNEFKTLKQLKILMKNAQKVKSTLLMAKKQDHFFKIVKIETIKPVKKIKQTYNNQNTNKSTDRCEENFKSLNNFLKKEIKICEKNQLHQNTFIYLKGFNSKRKMNFKDFLDEGFEVFVSSNILSILSEAGIQLEGLSSL